MSQFLLDQIDDLRTIAIAHIGNGSDKLLDHFKAFGRADIIEMTAQTAGNIHTDIAVKIRCVFVFFGIGHFVRQTGRMLKSSLF